MARGLTRACLSRVYSVLFVTKADILVAAVGQPELVRADWVKPGAVVLDVGTNFIDAPERKTGKFTLAYACLFWRISFRLRAGLCGRQEASGGCAL